MFFYLYSKKLLEKFKNNKSEEEDPNLLDTLSINNLFNNKENFFQIKENENTKDILNINNNQNNNNNNTINFTPSNNIKSSLFQPQNNNANMGNNYIYPSFPGLVPNPQNELFINQIPRISSIPNNLSMNSFYTGPKLLQNNYGNERSNLFGDIENINNLDPTNVSFFQMPIQNQISFNPLPNSLVSGKILANNIPNFMINNNTNINTNSNININKNINNIINLDNKNIINNNINNNNINNNININSNPNIKNENNNININSNPNIKIENNNIPLTNNNTKNNELNIKKDLTNKIKFTLINTNNNNNNLNKSTEKSKNMPTLEKINLPPIPNRQTPLFNIKESTLPDKDKDKEQKNQLISKKRNRFIKNNKLLFVQYDKDNENKEDKNDKNEKKNRGK